MSITPIRQTREHAAQKQRSPVDTPPLQGIEHKGDGRRNDDAKSAGNLGYETCDSRSDRNQDPSERTHIAPDSSRGGRGRNCRDGPIEQVAGQDNKHREVSKPGSLPAKKAKKLKACS